MALRWHNTTDLPDAELRRIYRAVKPSGLPAHDVYVMDCLTGGGFGVAVTRGAGGYRVVVAVSPRVSVQARMETFVYQLAHELHHLWQAETGLPQAERGAVFAGLKALETYTKGTR